MVYSTYTTEKKQVVANGMNGTDIQLSFDATFISVSLMVQWAFPTVKRKFTSGDPVMAGSNPALAGASVEDGMRISITCAVFLKMPCDLCAGMTIFDLFVMRFCSFVIFS